MPGTMERRLKFYTASPVFLPLCAALINFIHAMNTYCKWQSKWGTFVSALRASASLLVSISFTGGFIQNPAQKHQRKQFSVHRTEARSAQLPFGAWRTLYHMLVPSEILFENRSCASFPGLTTHALWLCDMVKTPGELKLSVLFLTFYVFCYIVVTGRVFTI